MFLFLEEKIYTIFYSKRSLKTYSMKRKFTSKVEILVRTGNPSIQQAASSRLHSQLKKDLKYTVRPCLKNKTKQGKYFQQHTSVLNQYFKFLQRKQNTNVSLKAYVNRTLFSYKTEHYLVIRGNHLIKSVITQWFLNISI